MSASVADELRAGFEQPFSRLGRDATHDRATVVMSWPSAPVELVRAAGFAPVFARGRSAATPAADRVLEAALFPNRLRQLVEAALTGRLTNVAALVLPRSSDPDYKCFLYLRELVRHGVATALPPVLLFDMLHSDDPAALAYNTDRARALLAQLASLAAPQTGPHDLTRVIASFNRARAAARRLHLQRAGAPRITGSEALPLLGAFWQLEPERYASLASAAAQTAGANRPVEGPRVLLAGAPIDSSVLHAAIEAVGGVVVAELSPFGGAGTSADIEVAEDPIASVAEHYRRESIDARMPVKVLMRKLEALLNDVEAVVISLPSDDASFGFDYPRIRELLGSRSIPHIVLDGDPACDATAADRERVRALLTATRPETSRG